MNSPIRNPAAVPTGRNLAMLNPDEVPAALVGDRQAARRPVLKRSMEQKGHYPTKVGFDLSSFATFRDFGVMDPQILYLLGVEPIWDDGDLVHDIRLSRPGPEASEDRRVHLGRRVLPAQSPGPPGADRQGDPDGLEPGRAGERRARELAAGRGDAPRQGDRRRSRGDAGRGAHLRPTGGPVQQRRVLLPRGTIGDLGLARN